MIQSFKVVNTLAAYRVVAHATTANTVQYPANAQNLPLGITVDTVKDTNTAIPVAGPGEIAKLLFNDTCAAGALVAGDTSGRGVPYTLANTSSGLTLGAAYVGILVGAAVAATGTIADVYICPAVSRGSY
jgi:hypothetical protein